MSETNSCREQLKHYCVGQGVDIGHGGEEPIVPHAICIDKSVRPDEWPNSRPAAWPTHLACDCFDHIPFDYGTLDFVFSSHCLEDAVDTRAALAEWTRILKSGGSLVLFLPDQAAYVEHCHAAGAEPNGAHKHADFSLQFVKDRLPSNVRVVYEEWPYPWNVYSFALVCQKV